MVADPFEVVDREQQQRDVFEQAIDGHGLDPVAVASIPVSPAAVAVFGWLAIGIAIEFEVKQVAHNYLRSVLTARVQIVVKRGYLVTSSLVVPGRVGVKRVRNHSIREMTDFVEVDLRKALVVALYSVAREVLRKVGDPFKIGS